jgi:hypothetical protein
LTETNLKLIDFLGFYFRKNEVEQQLKLFPALCLSNSEDQKKLVDGIKTVLELKHRRYLSIFQLGHDVSLTNTIFRAVFDRMLIEETCVELFSRNIIF